MYKITLKDGIVVDNLELNGNNYISQDEVSEDIFTTENTSHMVIEGGEKPEICENMILCNFWTAADGTHIIFREKSETDLMRERLEEYESAIIELAELIAEV